LTIICNNDSSRLVRSTNNNTKPIGIALACIYISTKEYHIIEEATMVFLNHTGVDGINHGTTTTLLSNVIAITFQSMHKRMTSITNTTIRKKI
jgi:hypothetical protein